jgi:adenylate cyclase
MRLSFRSFRARLLTFVLGLLLVVQAAVLLAVSRANESNARQHIDEALALTAGTFERALAIREQILLEKVRLLSSDFAFKQACAGGDHATLLSALENHRARVGADVMLTVSMDGEVEADTLHPDAYGVEFDLPELVVSAAADEFGEASSIEFIDGRPYQLVVVPLFTPDPAAWIVIGFVVDDGLARELQEGTGTHVSLLQRVDAGRWEPFASTLPDDLRPFLSRGLSAGLDEAGRSLSLDMGGREFVSWIAPAASIGGVRVVTVLQRSLDDALAPYLRLRVILAGVFGLGLSVSLLGGFLLANRVTRPVAALAEGARRVGEGDYTKPIEVAGQDELGLLAGAFNDMTQGLAERDRVRSLLGKVVSPAVADELLRKEIELGGEERLVSVLFSDIRNFTALSERLDPQALVGLLNAYLTGVSAIVEQHGGVVDKYIGDAVMALFGAPLAHPDDALRAVRTSLGMSQSLAVINQRIAREGHQPLAIGVGVNTDVVVAGNMGSKTRLNYTVVGDGVNLASRLEGLTKRYGVSVIVSQSTAFACPGLVFRELDRVRVKGRVAPVGIFEPLGVADELSAGRVAELERHAQALELFRARRFEAAAQAFQELASLAGSLLLYELYVERSRRFHVEPPDADWDGTIRYDEK